MTARIRIYRDQPFDASTEVNLDDFFLNLDGVTSTFTLTNKTNIYLGGTVQADGTQYYLYNGGFTKYSTDQFTLSSAPLSGSNLVAPGLICLPLMAYDQTGVAGVASSNVSETAFYIGDHVDIATRQYVNLDTETGITLQFRDQIGYGASNSWLQIAGATQDLAGTPTTYSATGAAFTTPNFVGGGQIAASSVAGSTAITLTSSADVADFVVGDYITINRGVPGSEETVKLLGKSGTTLTVNSTTFNHYPGETVYDSHRKLWVKLTVPVNANNGQPVNFYNVSLRVRGKVLARY